MFGIRRMIARLALAAVSAGTAPAAVADEIERTRTEFTFAVSPLLELHYHVRALAARTEDPPEAYRNAVQAVRDVERQMGPGIVWWYLEPMIVEMASVKELHERFDRLPNFVERPAGGRAPARSSALRISTAYLEIESDFLSEQWPRRREQLGRAKASIEATLRPKLDECLAFLTSHLVLNDPKIAVVIHLVTEAPPPGGATHPRRETPPVVVASGTAEESDMLFEIVLREMAGAIDAAGSNPTTAMLELRSGLRSAGFLAHFPEVRLGPGMLLHAHAAETVRRFLDPDHRDYAEAHGLYAELPVLSESLRTNWRAHLDGALTREEALRKVVEACRAAATPPDAPESP